jgi:hypothetical protein
MYLITFELDYKSSLNWKGRQSLKPLFLKSPVQGIGIRLFFLTFVVQ